ncbi:class I SAM-dependent methyltransferase [Cytobacillus kochii]|uniref:class I SAM-dependent DNA methyltransferase n=1 Tax=Cytobacillus kochii TaxID=859143 RepID=UPI002E22A8B7|nr:class I SAM-dependent methyltransferase [Cytobacillus kochii]
MSYQQFAYLYDGLMVDAPYEKWVSIVASQCNLHQLKGKRLLDLACGTGELSLRLAKKGYEVTGADLSNNMLAVAQKKAASEALSIQFLEQDMSQLDEIGCYDIITIFCDSLNYLQSEDEVKSTFSGVYEHLADDGLFMFDVHTVHKIDDLFVNQTFALNEEDVSYIWQSFEGEFPHSVEHDLSFFVLDEKIGTYKRYDECHFQRTYEFDVYRQWLKEAGFEITTFFVDFNEKNREMNDAERLFFICKKLKNRI